MATVLIFLLMVAFTCLLLTTKEDTSKKKYVLKFNHVLSESEPFHKGLKKWAQRVAERTDGRLEIQVFHSSQLGMEEEILELLRRGAPIGQNTDSARLGVYVPPIAVMTAPYFVDSIDDVVELRRLPTVKQWEKELEEQYGIKILSFNWVQGMRHMVTNKPIKKPVDMEGLRIRSPNAPIWQQTIRSLGSETVVLPFGEIYVGMEQKNINGAELVYRNITDAKLFEVAKYVSETRHILLINFQVVSKGFFDSLPPEYQKILVEECDQAGFETSKKMEIEVETLKAELSQKGMVIVQDVDVNGFQQASEETYRVLNLTNVRYKLYKEMGKR
jgi:tripartite ATP-independent transporter DctP family solute receptor